MKLLRYKEILFDDFATSNDGTYWAEICQECALKYRSIVGDAIDDGGTARGICSVKGCNNDGNREDVMHYYIDFEEYEILEE